MRRRALRSARCLSLVAVCLSAGVASSASAAEARYLYVLDCSARVQKLDMTTGRTTASTALAQRSTLVPTHGDAANSVPDGCATYGAAYSAKAHLLYTVAPLTGSFHGTPRRYRVLTFRLPGLHAGPVIDLQEAYGDEDAPQLAQDAGVITVSGGGRTRRTDGDHFVAGAGRGARIAGQPSSEWHRPVSSLSGSGRYRRAGCERGRRRVHPAGARGRRRAGAVHPEGDAAYATVNAGARTFTPLAIPFRTVDERVHLAPDGKAVVVQEARPGAVPGLAATHGSNGHARCRERKGRQGVDGILGRRLVPADGHAGGAVGVLSWRRDAAVAAHGRAASGRGRRPAARHRAGVLLRGPR